MDGCPDGLPFAVVCFLVRVVEALGAAALTTSSFAIIANTFPNSVTAMFVCIQRPSLTRDTDSNFVRLSVRRCVPVFYGNRLRYCHSFFSPQGSPIILLLSVSNSNIFAKFRRGHTCVGAKYRWGIKISRFSTNISQTIEDMA